MVWTCESLQFPRLRAAASNEEYLLHQAALEWSLTDPIIINSAEDIKSAESWQDLLKPYEHQVQNLITFCRRLPVSLVADDVGLGKTISAGLILSELLKRQRVTRALVLCPKILLPQWEEELIQKFRIAARACSGKSFADELRKPTQVVITTYETARLYFADIEPANFNFLILDEAHRLRNLYGPSADPQSFANEIKRALTGQIFRYVLMLTATPLHNRLWDLYSLIDCLAATRKLPNPFGDPHVFAARFLSDNSSVARRLKPERAAEFRGILSQYMVRTRRAEVRLLFPKREVRLLRVSTSPVEDRLTDMVRELLQGLNALVQTSISQAMMSSPEALLAQLDNMARNKSVPLHSVEVIRVLLARPTERTGKLNALHGLIGELRRERPKDWRVVVFTSRKETQRAIGASLSGQGIAVGYISDQGDAANQRAIANFRAEPPQANVLISTDRGAQGVNLQASNVLVNYDLPWNPMTVEQRIGRVQRLSSKHDKVIICNLVVKGSVEERIVARLMSKLQMIAHAVGDIEAILESAGYDGDETDTGSFESQIRGMVLRSLLGQDSEAAAAAMLASIERGQKMIDDRQDELDQTLGSLDHLHKSGAAPPVLTRVTPSIPLKDFVTRALTSDGARVEPDLDGTFEIRRKGASPDLATFDVAISREASIAGTFGGRPVLLFQPGQPPFERLTQAWCMKSGHRVADLRVKNAAECRHLAQVWLDTVEGSVLGDTKQTSTVEQFLGSVMCRVKAVVAHDSYEKLTRHSMGDTSHGDVTAIDEPSRETLKTDLAIPDLCPGLDSIVSRAIEADPDVTAFCSFYEQRRVEELSLAGSEERRRQKINLDFTPRVFGEVVAASGVVYSTSTMRVEYTIDGHGPYASTIRGIPSIRRVLETPSFAECEISGRRLPIDVLDPCSISGKRAARHLLVKSQESGRLALPVHGVNCQASGALVLADEVDHSEVSGKVVRKSILMKSAVSGRSALEEELQRCDFTGTPVFPTELQVSNVSAKRYREDEGQVSSDGEWTGHRSEFARCEETGDTTPLDQLEASGVSGKRVRRELLVTSEGAAGLRALKAEMEVCSITGKTLASTEVGSSGVTGRRVSKALLHPSAKSGVLGLLEEMKVCQRSGQLLSPTEVETCVVTNIVADREELRQSAVSGQWAVPEETSLCSATGKRALLSELKTCEASGKLFLPAGLERCRATGKLVDRRLLVRSQTSDLLALPEAMVRCAKTNMLVLPEELVACEETGLRVLKSELERCAITGELVLRDRLVWSDVSQVPMRRARAVLSVRGGYCLPAEAQVCTWLNGPLLPKQTGICKLTGLLFSTDLLNAAGEFGVLRDMLDGTTAGDQAPAVVTWLAQTDSKRYSGAKSATSVGSPSRHLFAVCVETKAILGLVTKYLGLLVRNTNPPQITGRIVEGKRSGQRWNGV